MKIIFGKKGTDSKNILYLDEYDLSLPMGSSFWEKPVDFLNSLTFKFVDNEEFLQLFKFYKNSLWWLVLPSVNASINSAINFIDKFEAMIVQNNPSSLYLANELDRLSIIQQICKKHKIQFNYSKVQFIKYKIKKNFLLTFQPYRYAIIKKFKTYHRKKLFSRLGKSTPSFVDKIVLFSPSVYRRTYYDHITGKTEEIEYLLQPILNYLNETKTHHIGIDVDYTFFGQKIILHKRLKDLMDWIPLEQIDKQKSDSQIKRFLHDYKKLLANASFQELFTFNGINFWENTRIEFYKQTYMPALPTFLDLILSLDKFFTKQPPKLVFITYEKGPYGIIMTMICKKLRIKTVGIQHSAFHVIDHVDYSYTNLQNENNLYGLPLTDLTLVWGNAAKKFLMDKGYEENQLEVFGNPEFFDFDKNIDLFQQSDFKEKFHVPRNKKILLFTTGKLQSFYKIEGKRVYDELVLKKLLKSYANNDDYYVIIKPHPRHEPTHIYQKIIDECKCTNFSIKQGNILEMLEISDALISIESTTLLDSIAMGKPTFAVTFNDQASSTHYAKNNVLILSPLELLDKKINDALTNSKLQDDLLKNQKNFIKENYNYPNNNFRETLSKILNV